MTDNRYFVKFQKKRDMGEVLNDTFAFLRLNYIMFGKSVLFYVGPFLLVTAIATVFYKLSVTNLLSGIYRSNFWLDILSNLLGWKFWFTILSSYVSSVVMLSVVYSYIVLYVAADGRRDITPAEVWGCAKANMLSVGLTMIPIGLLCGIGYLFCFLPGIWLQFTLSVIYIIRIYEQKGFGDSFNRSFSLVCSSFSTWGVTFLCILIVNLIIYFACQIFTLPQSIINFVESHHLLDQSPGKSLEMLDIILTLLTSFFTNLFASVSMITIALQYFNLVEQKEYNLLFQKVDQICDTENTIK